MSTFERSIVGILEPSIKVDRIQQPDIGSEKAKEETTAAVPQGVNTKNEDRWGAYMPLIMVNTTRFDEDEINTMTLNVGGKFPTIQVSLFDVGGKMKLDTPMDGDVISVYLRPPDETNQKPIRIDFDITSVSGDPSSQQFGFEGVMKIPGMFAEQCKSFPKGNSFDHLQDVAEELKIGFASNETSTDDQMARMVAFENYETFINKTVKHTYKDDDSFFDWYVDPFYYLCLVNINKQFSLEDKTEQINISTTAPLSGQVNDDKAKSSFKGDLVLTNRTDRNGTNVYIENFAQVNNSAQVWINNGYKRYSQYLSIDESNEIEYVSTFVDPLTTPGAEEDQIIQKGRPKDEFYKKQVKYKWLGKQSSDNTHENYIFSALLNFQNLQELQKMSLNVELAGMNFYIYRYMRIPILIYETASKGSDMIGKIKDRDKALGEDTNYGAEPKEEQLEGGRNSEGLNKPGNEQIGSDPRDQIKNEHLSGYYLVNTIKYTYEKPGPVKMKMNLIRREWPIPAKNKNY